MMNLVLGIDPPIRAAGLCGMVVLNRVFESAPIEALDLTAHAHDASEWAAMVVRAAAEHHVEAVAFKGDAGCEMVRAVLHRAGLDMPLCMVRFQTRRHLERAICLIDNRQIELRGAPSIAHDLAEVCRCGASDRVQAMLAGLALLFEPVRPTLRSLG